MDIKPDIENVGLLFVSWKLNYSYFGALNLEKPFSNNSQTSFSYEIDESFIQRIILIVLRSAIDSSKGLHT